MFQQEVKFQILDEKIKTTEQVFNHLVYARNVLTREEGYLLCSHYSKWPSSLISQATWLAGCFTPAEHQDQKNLVFGVPNPEHQINWMIDPVERSVVLRCGGVSSETREELGIELVWEEIPKQFDEYSEYAERKIKAVKRLLFGTRTEASAFDIVMNVLRYMMDFSQFWNGECFYVLAVLGQGMDIHDLTDSAEDRGINLRIRNGDYSCVTPDGIEFSFKGSSHLSKVFNSAEPLPYHFEVLRRSLSRKTTVIRDIPEAGWAQSENIFLEKNGNKTYVRRDISEYGFGQAVKLPYDFSIESYGDYDMGFPTLTVIFDQEKDGFLEAIDLRRRPN